MREKLPLFPLGTVLFPGLVLPLHIFEERYKRLAADLLGSPEPRRFGVIAIREGRETGADGVTALHEIGCVAVVRDVTERDDGQYDVTAVGAERFRIGELDRSRPYLVGEVELLAEEVGDKDRAMNVARGVRQSFRGYLDALTARGSATISVPDLPDEPLLLSYIVAASLIIELTDRQDLLARPDALARLLAERALLAREAAMLRVLGATPAPGLRSAPYSSN